MTTNETTTQPPTTQPPTARQTTVGPATTGPPRSAARSTLVEFAADIKLSHSIFALPFALLAAVLASRATPARTLHVGQLALIVGCMVVGRSFAMGMNRLLDARLDAANPRTARRAIPAGRLSKRAAIGVLAACAVAFEAIALGFLRYDNPWPAMLALPVLATLGAYPFFKRFTRYCHFYLGACLALAPACAWVAIAATWDPTPWIMGAAVLCWTAGFDILYATQDYDHDVRTSTFSIPAKVGIARALWVARLTHVACVGLLVLLGVASPSLDLLWFVAVALVSVVFIVEHSIVRPDDLSRLNLAFFTLNGFVSLTLGTLGIIDALGH